MESVKNGERVLYYGYERKNILEGKVIGYSPSEQFLKLEDLRVGCGVPCVDSVRSLNRIFGGS